MFVIHPETRTVYRAVNLNHSMKRNLSFLQRRWRRFNFSGIRHRVFGSRLLQNVDKESQIDTAL